MYSLISITIVLLMLTTLVISDDKADEELNVNKITSLCEHTYVNAADRMVNNTVRLYRGENYWDLIGLPDPVGHLDGPYPIWYPNMAPVLRNHTIVSLLGGSDKGVVCKTDGKSVWGWNTEGKLVIGSDSAGVNYNRFPKEGFEAAFHNGNNDQPLFIGFRNIYTYYMDTKYRLWFTVGNPNGHIKGMNNETFPTDINAAFTLPAEDPKDIFIGYFFRGTKFCRRRALRLESRKECDEWIDNSVLFGCTSATSQPNVTDVHLVTTGGPPSAEPTEAPAGGGQVVETTTKSSNHNFVGSLSLVLSVLCFILYLN